MPQSHFWYWHEKFCFFKFHFCYTKISSCSKNTKKSDNIDAADAFWKHTVNQKCSHSKAMKINAKHFVTWTFIVNHKANSGIFTASFPGHHDIVSEVNKYHKLHPYLVLIIKRYQKIKRVHLKKDSMSSYLSKCKRNWKKFCKICKIC